MNHKAHTERGWHDQTGIWFVLGRHKSPHFFNRRRLEQTHTIDFADER